MNAVIHSVLERDVFSKMDFMSFEEAYDKVDCYIDFYNNRKMHGSLKRMPPAKFSEWVMQLQDRSMFHKAL